MGSTIITAKELRDKLPEVVKGLRNGRSYTLRYRSVNLGTISPIEPMSSKPEPGSHEAIMEALKHLPSKESLKDVPEHIDWKKEYGKHLEEKYGKA